MTVPGEAAGLLLWGLALGAVMGLCYDFLSPLRRKRNAPADLVFVLAALYLWVYYSFKICRGDIRLGGTAALGIGCILWLCTLGKVFRRVFGLFWLVIFRIFSLFCRPFIKNFQKRCRFIKKVFAYGKKRGYNRGSIRHTIHRRSGGAQNE